MVIIAASFASTCGGSGVGHVPSTTEEGRDFEEVKERAQQTQNKAAETAKEANEASETWTDWAKEKISEGLGFNKDADAKDAPKKASDTVSDTAKKSEEVASGNIN